MPKAKKTEPKQEKTEPRQKKVEPKQKKTELLTGQELIHKVKELGNLSKSEFEIALGRKHIRLKQVGGKSSEAEDAIAS